jgi:hypothetical protein
MANTPDPLDVLANVLMLLDTGELDSLTDNDVTDLTTLLDATERVRTGLKRWTAALEEALVDELPQDHDVVVADVGSIGVRRKYRDKWQEDGSQEFQSALVAAAANKAVAPNQFTGEILKDPKQAAELSAREILKMIYAPSKTKTKSAVNADDFRVRQWYNAIDFKPYNPEDVK